MKLKQLPFTAGNSTRFLLDYSLWLADGTHITAFTAAIDPLSVTTATVTTVSVAPEGEGIFFVNGGAVNETFTVDVQGTDSRGQIVKDTIGFTVVAP